MGSQTHDLKYINLKYNIKIIVLQNVKILHFLPKLITIHFLLYLLNGRKKVWVLLGNGVQTGLKVCL